MPLSNKMPWANYPIFEWKMTVVVKDLLKFNKVNLSIDKNFYFRKKNYNFFLVKSDSDMVLDSQQQH